VHLIVLSVLAAITSAFSTLPTNAARAYVTYALLHPTGQPASCQASWDGIEPTVSEYDVFLAACTLIYSPALTPDQRNSILSDLPTDCYPPGIPPTCNGSLRTKRSMTGDAR
jgi:hypothetical protein